MTLLEIMLVLAIAAMIIVMSVRYYQSATTAQQANDFLQQLQAITAAASNVSEGTVSYSNFTLSRIIPILPKNGLQTPWGSTITDFPERGVDYFSIQVKIPKRVCLIVMPTLRASGHWYWNSAKQDITDNLCNDLDKGDSMFYFR